MWVIGAKDREGRWRKLAKVAGEKFYLSAQDAFDALGEMDPEIAKSFGVFEIPCLKVFELASPDEEGKSCRYDPVNMEKALILIDGLCLLSEGHPDPKALCEEIYTLAHAAHGHCGNPHKDWLDRIPKVAERLKEMKIVNMEKVLCRDANTNVNASEQP
jgi:hypothetical protein